MNKKGNMMPKPRVLQLSPEAAAELDKDIEWAMQDGKDRRQAQSRWTKEVMSTILYLRDEKGLAFPAITAILNRKFPACKWIVNTVQVRYRQHTFVEGN